MARPPTIRDEDLLEAARAEFLAHGIRATTMDIARRAGVSEGTLFKRFKTKEALFREALDFRKLEEEAEHLYMGDLPARVGTSTVPEVLTELGTVLLSKFMIILPMSLMHQAGRTSGADVNGPPESALRGFRALESYLEGEMNLGRIEKVDPEALRVQFIGALWQYAFEEISMPEGWRPKVGQKAFVRHIVQTLWRGISPQK